MGKKVVLGNTGLVVNPLIFGTLPLGPLQADLPPEKGAELIRHALELGVDLIDTAELYGTYAHIRQALTGFTGKFYLASKTHATSAGEARSHVERALKEMDLGALDIVHIHAARVEKPFEERATVFEELLKMKEEGMISNVGLSSHYCSAIEQASKTAELDVVHPLINKDGMGIVDGSSQRMAQAISRCSEAGKGVYAMKALAGGNLIGEARNRFKYVLGLQGVHAVAVGMLAKDEIEGNFQLFNSGIAEASLWSRLEKREPKIHVVEKWCKGCGQCVPACTNAAISMVNGKAKVDREKCILCGYCAAACPDFIIRVL